MSGDGAPRDIEAPGGLPGALKAGPLLHGVILGLFCLATATGLSLADRVTSDAIARRAAEDLQASLAQVIPAALHGNDLSETMLSLEDRQEGMITAYRATQGGIVKGVAFEISASGYAGRIRVLLGVAPNGELLGARVLSHTETPGLGDKIEAAKSDWILGFTGLSLQDPAPENWKVRRDGGVFDQFSGATITPRAVVDGVRRGLELFERNRALLLAPPQENS